MERGKHWKTNIQAAAIDHKYVVYRNIQRTWKCINLQQIRGKYKLFECFHEKPLQGASAASHWHS